MNFSFLLLNVEESASFSHCSAVPESVGFGVTKEKVDEEVQSAGCEENAELCTIGKRKAARELFPEASKKGL